MGCKFLGSLTLKQDHMGEVLFLLFLLSQPVFLHCEAHQGGPSWIARDFRKRNSEQLGVLSSWATCRLLRGCGGQQILPCAPPIPLAAYVPSRDSSGQLHFSIQIT
jgi:hypothetical protein